MTELFDVPTADTLTFLEPHLQGPHRILEVGCGSGHLAQALQARGHDVLALDNNPEAVRRTTARGVPAQLATWPAFESEPVDVVLFTRTLHHFPDLDATLDRAVALLRPGGQILVEDYAITELDPLGAAWLNSMLQTLSAAGVLQPSGDSFATRLLSSNGDLPHALGPDQLFSAATMRAGLTQRCSEVEANHAPYLYRYALSLLPRDERGQAILAQLLASERTLIDDGSFAPLGRRFVARL